MMKVNHYLFAHTSHGTFLNTIAHYGEMSELDIAKWSGRINANQNRVYNHVSEEDMLDKIKAIKLNRSNYCQKGVNTHK